MCILCYFRTMYHHGYYLFVCYSALMRYRAYFCYYHKEQKKIRIPVFRLFVFVSVQCCVVLFALFVFVQCTQMLPVSLDCPFFYCPFGVLERLCKKHRLHKKILFCKKQIVFLNNKMFVCIQWCPTHIVLCFWFVCLRLAYPMLPVS